MNCPICDNEKVNKLFLSENNDKDLEVIACDECKDKEKKK